MKKLIALMLCLCLMTGIIPAVAESENTVIYHAAEGRHHGGVLRLRQGAGAGLDGRGFIRFPCKC